MHLSNITVYSLKFISDINFMNLEKTQSAKQAPNAPIKRRGERDQTKHGKQYPRPLEWRVSGVTAPAEGVAKKHA